MFGAPKKIKVPPPPKGKGPPPERWVQLALSQWWNEAIVQGDEVPTDPSRSEFLRPSALPFCPLSVGYTRITEGIETERHRSFKENFYVDIGHAVHELLQNFVGRMEVEHGVKVAVKTLGHWKCPECSRTRRFTTYKRCKCGGKPNYEEIAIHWRSTVGHIDKVIRVGNLLFILDYKTCGSFALIKYRKAKQERTAPNLPYPKNRAQITRYAGLFEKVFKDEFQPGGRFEGCTVVGCILAYISRETVNQREFIYLPADEKMKRRGYKLAKKDDRNFVRMKEAVQKKDKSIFLKFIDEKPCKTRDFYDEEFHDNFNPCPLAKVCFNPERLKKTVMDALKK